MRSRPDEAAVEVEERAGGEHLAVAVDVLAGALVLQAQLVGPLVGVQVVALDPAVVGDPGPQGGGVDGDHAAWKS